jgi:lysophospholipase L1-like esterase
VSHARNPASLLQDNLGIDNKVSSFVKPGAQMNVITNMAREEIKSLKCDNVVVICGGANDISRNNMKEALKNVTEFVKGNKEVNIVLTNAPHRHDLIPESCVNKEVLQFNKQVRKIVKLQRNVLYCIY